MPSYICPIVAKIHEEVRLAHCFCSASVVSDLLVTLLVCCCICHERRGTDRGGLFFDIATVLFVLLSGWFLLFLVFSVCFCGGDHNNWKDVLREAYRV